MQLAAQGADAGLVEQCLGGAGFLPRSFARLGLGLGAPRTGLGMDDSEQLAVNAFRT